MQISKIETTQKVRKIRSDKGKLRPKKTKNNNDILYITFALDETLQKIPDYIKILIIGELQLGSENELSQLNLPFGLEKLYISKISIIGDEDIEIQEKDILDFEDKMKIPFNCEFSYITHHIIYQYPFYRMPFEENKTIGVWNNPLDNEKDTKYLEFIIYNGMYFMST
jgi:hypothetical protein